MLQCIFELHVQKTFRCASNTQYPKNPSSKFSLVYWRKRKNTRALSATTVPYSGNKLFDCRTCFLKILRLFGHADARHLIPECTYKQDRWTVHTDPQHHCSYNTFLDMYRAVMRLAGNLVRTPGMDGQSDILPTLHEPRHGFVREARSATIHKPLKFEVVGKHGGTQTVFASCRVTTELTQKLTRRSFRTSSAKQIVPLRMRNNHPLSVQNQAYAGAKYVWVLQLSMQE